MKRFASGLICTLMIAAALTGCASPAKDTSTPQNTQADTQQAAAGDKAPTGKVVYGEISDIAGNEVTLKLIEMPQQVQRDPNATPRPKGEHNQDAQASPAPQSSDGSGTNPGAGREIKYTGETADIIIPVGMKITMNAFGGIGGGQRPQGRMGNGQGSGQGNGQNRNSNQPRATRDPNATPHPETEVELSALKVGWTLTITYHADNTTIEKISARQPRSSGADNAGSN